MTRFRPSLVAALLLAAILTTGAGFATSAQRPSSAGKSPPAEDSSISEMRALLEYFVQDRGSLQRSYPVASSPARREHFRTFYGEAPARIRQLNFDGMNESGKVDYVLFRTHLERALGQLDIEENKMAGL